MDTEHDCINRHVQRVLNNSIAQAPPATPLTDRYMATGGLPRLAIAYLKRFGRSMILSFRQFMVYVMLPPWEW